MDSRMLGRFYSDPATATKVNMEAVYEKFGMPAAMIHQPLALTISKQEKASEGCPYLFHITLPGTTQEFRAPFTIGKRGTAPFGGAEMQYTIKVSGDDLNVDVELSGVGKIHERYHFTEKPDGITTTFTMPGGVVGSRTYLRVKDASSH